MTTLNGQRWTKPMAKYGSLYERLVANTRIPEDQNEHTGCWLWTGNLHYKGYGRLNVWRGGKLVKVYAHRCMAEHCLGRPLGPDEEPDHLCFNRACINPDHLDPVPRTVNLARRRKAA